LRREGRADFGLRRPKPIPLYRRGRRPARQRVLHRSGNDRLPETGIYKKCETDRRLYRLLHPCRNWLDEGASHMRQLVALQYVSRAIPRPSSSVRPDHQSRPYKGILRGRKQRCGHGGVDVRRHISKEAERNALEVLHIEKARTALAIRTRKPLSIECKDPRVRAVLITMEQHIEGRLPIEELAASVGLSRRQLATADRTAR
jgi:hypothetical protein